MILIVFRSFKYRLYPTQAQKRRLNSWLDATRWLYNAALQQRRDVWRTRKKSISLFDQTAEIPGLREVWPELNQIPSVILRGSLRCLEKSFQAFFHRCKIGETPGYPRFKAKFRWNSLFIDDLENKHPIVSGGRRVHIPLLGKVKLKLHRPVEGKPKALRIKRDQTGQWWVSICCENVEPKPLPKTNKTVGVDLGLIHFAATSDGEIYKNSRPLATARISLERAARRLNRRKKGSNRRRETRRLLAKKHAHVANIRREQHIKIARDLVQKYDTIFIEKLNIKGLVRSALAKSIIDAAWGNFLHWLFVKAESAGRTIVEVDPHGTSQRCSGCNTEVEKSLKERVHQCPHCGLVLDRDVNAARNIKRLGESLRGDALLVEGRRGSVKPKFSQRQSDHTDVTV